MDSDKLSIDLKNNPKVAEAIAGASPGDTVKFTDLEICIDEIAVDMMVGSVCDMGEVSVTPGPEEDDNESEPSDQETAPVLSVMAPRSQPK